ncbi:hypothetical protein LTR33_005739 [Friedmanniomyces endolithicus]|nr:hypothetical protein LTR33_005739 [Friedmanniomyces endolithicus]
MPSILSDDDKQTVKRAVPKANNKIQAVAVAKLYISLPNHRQWIPTGLQGAAVLADDLVGNTFWLKLVDVSPSNRGVLWDQEIYDTFQYNQDRTFFHSFEGEECLFGLSFVDEKEARQFKKKMDEREKNASKTTRAKPFAAGPAQTGYGGQQATQSVGGSGGKSLGRFGGLFSSHKNSGGSPQGPVQSIIPPRGVEIQSQYGSAQASPLQSRPASSSGIDLSDPDVQAVLQDLLQMGITEDQIEENAGFIKSYLEQKKATSAAEAEKKERANRAPPPPPPITNIANLSPQNTGSSTGTSRRGPPPAPPPSRRTATGAQQRPPSPSPSPPPREPSPPRPRFRAPPPLADAGRFANQTLTPPTPGRSRVDSNAGPPPPPRPPKGIAEEESNAPSAAPPRFAVPPPFDGKRITSGPPPTPARGAVPPPPPPRDSTHGTPTISGIPPPPPPRGSPNPNAHAVSFADGPPPPPPLPPSNARPVPSAPPLPPPNTSFGGPGGPPPPPPPMPPRGVDATTQDSAAAAAASAATAAPGRGGLLADIQRGARLKKVGDQEKRDRSAVVVPGGEAVPAAAGGGGKSGGGDGGGGLANALADALAARKSKVSHSDDEKDDDDW